MSTPTNTPPWHDADTLRELYIHQRMAIDEVGTELGCSHGTIANWLEKHEIPTRPTYDPPAPELHDEATFRRLYVDEGLSQSEMAERLGCTQGAVSYWQRKHKIPARSFGEHQTPPALKDAELLRRLYVDERLHQNQIGAELGVDGSTVNRWLHRHEIPTRGRGTYSGPENPSWNGGISRYFVYGPTWGERREETLRADGYACRSCGITDAEHREKCGMRLDVHHIVPFYRFDDPDVAHADNNLITLCRSCHGRYEGIPIDNRRDNHGTYNGRRSESGVTSIG